MITGLPIREFRDLHNKSNHPEVDQEEKSKEGDSDSDNGSDNGSGTGTGSLLEESKEDRNHPRITPLPIPRDTSHVHLPSVNWTVKTSTRHFSSDEMSYTKVIELNKWFESFIMQNSLNDNTIQVSIYLIMI